MKKFFTEFRRDMLKTAYFTVFVTLHAMHDFSSWALRKFSE